MSVSSPRTRTRRARRGAGLLVTGAVVASVFAACADPTPGTAAPDRAAGSSTSPPASSVELPEPVFVKPVVDPSTYTTAVITPDGGEVALELPGGDPNAPTIATLTMPPGAVESDTAITLLAVTALDASADGTTDSAESWRGVKILPSGLMFPLDALPALTFTNVSDEFLSSTWGWTTEGVLHVAAATPESTSSVRVAVPHFSGYGGGDTPTPGAGIPAEQASVRQRVNELLAEAVRDPSKAAANNELAKQEIETFSTKFLEPLAKAASTKCEIGLRRTFDVWIWVSWMAQMLGAGEPSETMLDPVVTKDLECTRAACAAGDPTAAGRLWDIMLIGTMSDLVDGDRFDDLLGESRTTFADCTAWIVTVSIHGQGLASFGDSPEAISLRSDLLSSGVVTGGDEALIPARLTDNAPAQTAQVLWAFTKAGSTLIGLGDEIPDPPAGGWESLCTTTGYEPSALRVQVIRQPGVEPAVPMVSFNPQVHPQTYNCGGEPQTDNSLLFLLIVTSAQMGLPLVGLPFEMPNFVHRFSEAERVGNAWTYSEEITWDNGRSQPGRIEVTVSLQPATEIDPRPRVTSTEGMVDIGATQLAGGG